MEKKVAVIAVNPVNGLGLFHYLETFYEKGISYKVFAIAAGKTIHTNSGITLQTDDIVSNLKGHAAEYDALLFTCGDAIPVFKDHANEPYNLDMLEVIREFAAAKKLLIGHCAAALIFEIAGISEGKKLAVHPLAKPVIQKGIATDEDATIDENFYTAQCEHAIPALIPHLLKVLA